MKGCLRGCLGAILPSLIFMVLVLVAMILLQAIFRPWGRSLTGQRTLTGQWVGSGALPSGKRIAVHLRLGVLFWGDDPCPRGCDFEGGMKVCIAADPIREYELEGEVGDRQGSTFRFNPRKTIDAHYGYSLGDVTGFWPGGDTLRLTSSLNVDRSDTVTSEPGVWIDVKGERHRFDRDDQFDFTRPFSLTLHRGTEAELQRACATRP